jgi:hypothetical protein
VAPTRAESLDSAQEVESMIQRVEKTVDDGVLNKPRNIKLNTYVAIKKLSPYVESFSPKKQDTMRYNDKKIKQI